MKLKIFYVILSHSNNKVLILKLTSLRLLSIFFLNVFYSIIYSECQDKNFNHFQFYSPFRSFSLMMALFYSFISCFISQWNLWATVYISICCACYHILNIFNSLMHRSFPSYSSLCYLFYMAYDETLSCLISLKKTAKINKK